LTFNKCKTYNDEGHPKNNNKSVSMMPAAVKYIPFLKIEFEGKNMKNEDTTKNNNASPKNIFK